MFVFGKVIDKEKIASAIAQKKSMTFESLKQTIVTESLTIEDMAECEGFSYEKEEVNINDMYLSNFSRILFDLTLDELEFIRDNNLFEFDKDSLLDYRCQINLNKRINELRQTLEDIIRCSSIDNIGSYFQRFTSIQEQAKQGSKLETILGLNRDNVILTPMGIKLKTCIENLKNMHIEFLKESKKSLQLIKQQY